MENEKGLPKWLWYLLAASMAYLILICFLAGVEKQEEEAARDQAIAERLVELERPLGWSQPYEFFTVWEKVK